MEIIDGVEATGGLSNIVEDTTPQLGGDLDLNSHNISGTGNIAGTTYGSDGSISDAELLTLDDGATTQILVGGGAGSAPVWTTASGTGAPVRAGSPTFTTQIITPQIYGSAAASGGLALGSTSDATKGNITVGRMTLSDLANADGIVFGSLGTATKGIDFTNSNLAGTDDWLYLSAANKWGADGEITASSISAGTVTVNNLTGGNILIGASKILYSAADYSLPIHADSTRSVIIGNCSIIGTWVADGVSSAGTANITDVGGAAHGLSLAVGDLVHISDCTTASHKGFYRIVTAGATTLVLDRVLAATDTDLTVKFYKDVIGFFATDGTNGQRIMNYSHQNKPLQIGGDVLAATATLTGKDLYIGGDIGFSGETANAAVATVMSNVGPTGAQTAIQGWIKIIDSGGTARYIPYW